MEHIGQTVVVEELALAVLLAYFEWQEGVFNAERPAESAMWSSGRDGRENSSWCVLTNKSAREFHRLCEYIVCEC